MIKPDKIKVLYGGTSAEREVSLASGRAIAGALEKHYEVELILLDADALPDVLSRESVVFPALHGTFGEDGGLQALLDEAGIEYCGSDAAVSRLCMDKVATKAIAHDLQIPTPESVEFDGAKALLADDIISRLGTSLVVKPADQGSSVGLHFAEHRSGLGIALSQIHSGRWLVEQRIRGRELTVGVLNGAAMGIVEIVSASGVYDYKAKYTAGTTEYRFPAEIDPNVAATIKESAEQVFRACGCRDFARIDFLLDGARPYFLEVNTLPGLTATSLLPKSASCVGLDFDSLAAELVAPAVARLKEAQVE
jgi:D-alanine-D-alanine ligase